MLEIQQVCRSICPYLVRRSPKEHSPHLPILTNVFIIVLKIEGRPRVDVHASDEAYKFLE